jgi:hypothetical protein
MIGKIQVELKIDYPVLLPPMFSEEFKANTYSNLQQKV